MASVSLATRIVEARTRLDISQQELATRAGVGIRSVSRWETGKCRPRRRELAALASALGLTVAELRQTDDAEAAARRVPDDLAPVLDALRFALDAAEGRVRRADGERPFGRRASDHLTGAEA